MTAAAKEFAENLWQSSGCNMAQAIKQLEQATYEQLIYSGGSFKEKLTAHDQVMLELVRLDAEQGLRGSIGIGTWRSPLERSSALRESIKELTR